MKCVGYLLLVFGIVSPVAWGQSATQNEPVVVVRYVARSCNSAQPVVRTAKPKPEVVLGAFESLQATVLSASSSLVLWHTSAPYVEEEMETLLGKTGSFSLPAVIVGSRMPMPTSTPASAASPKQSSPSALPAAIADTPKPAPVPVAVVNTAVRPANVVANPVVASREPSSAPVAIVSASQPNPVEPAKRNSRPQQSYKRREISIETLRAH